ncbi:MAG: hypothetical protein AAGI44_09655 [Pseudomonadota bacterium]
MTKRLTFTAPLLVCTGLVVGCVAFVCSTTRTRVVEEYVQVKTTPQPADRHPNRLPYIAFDITSTPYRDSEDLLSRLFSRDAYEATGSPHTLSITAQWEGNTGSEFDIDRLEVTATGLARRVVVEQSKMDLLVLPLFDHASGYSQAVFTVPLDPIVPFIDRQTLRIALLFSVSDTAETYRIESSFIAARSEHIVYRIDELLSAPAFASHEPSLSKSLRPHQ